MRELRLSSGKVTLVDDEDYPRIAKLSLHEIKAKGNSTAYARAYISKTKRLLVHRLILNATSKDTIDHINGNGLDNRRSNLRFCAQSENCHKKNDKRLSSSGFRGVYPSATRGVWRSQICVKRRIRYLGRFATAEAAARAYDEIGRAHV